MSDKTVLIIGGGLGGLTLAQALRVKGIPFKLFERDISPMARDQGWAILIDIVVPILKSFAPPGAPPLEWTSVNKEVEDTDHPRNGPAGYIVDALTGKVLQEVGSHSSIRSNRSKLREWLSTGLDIQWGKHFVRHEVTEKGSVVAFFDDGSSEEGRILVGADGVSSKIRASFDSSILAPAVPVPVAVVNGEVTVDREHYLEQMSIAPSLYLASAGPTRLFVGLRSFSAEGNSPHFATYFWTLMTDDGSPADPDMWMHKASKEELLVYTREKCKDMLPKYRSILDFQRADLVRPWSFPVSMPAITPDGPVTLIGDAAHAMPPFRGMGGNQAILDAVKLAEELGKGVDEQALKAYEKEMVPRTSEVVESSVNAFNSL